ncbi:MAG TPA: NADH-ubiquinone oxidoreductase-F iron-sulfur binding region domain-containing protein [Solirubrobacteraceae bacterium]|nr:NADH-ubiquinone oxidoreductase-F iron-sulfur binding region domain-containing protein [Solirubrobacteraceae bacterium]
MTFRRPDAAHHGLPRLLAGLTAGGQGLSLAEHESVHGPLPSLTSAELIEAVRLSGLRGRGGADFPTARKLQAVAQRSRVSAVVVNGSETEPASQKDRLLLARLPHLVLDGALLCAEAVGAGEVVVRVPERASRVLSGLERALAERRERIPVSISTGPGSYVSGEESAVIHQLNGGRPLPSFVPPRPFERGLRGRPTLVQNPETLAQVALVARFGPAWYRELGTAADPGSALVTISGAVGAPGVYELAFGTPMSDLIEAAGGASEPLQALLVGGYFGTWVRAEAALGLALAREDLRSVGCALGSGVVIALGRRACGLAESSRVIEFLAAQSAHQCGPCTYGLRAVADGFAALHAGRAGRALLADLQRWTVEINGRGACHHPNGAVRFAQSALAAFGDDIESHRRGPCHGLAAGLPLGPPLELAGRRGR